MLKSIKIQNAKLLIILSIIITTTVPALSQSIGIYLSYNDYISHNCKYISEKNDRNTKIYIQNSLNTSKLIVYSKNIRVKIDLDSIYGVRDANNTLFRVWNKNLYKLEDSDSLYIYSRNLTTFKRIQLARRTKLKKEVKTYFYYSCDPTSPIHAINKIAPEQFLLILKNNKCICKF